MTGKTTTDRKPRSAARRPRVLERVLIVAAVAAVLVGVGAWIAMGRPADGAAASGARSSAPSVSSGESSAPATEEAPVAATPSAAPAAEEAPVTSAPAPSSAPAAAGPTPATAFLGGLASSGLAPPVDDEQQLAMAADVCAEMSYGSTRDDMVRALTFAGASDAEAANFVQLAITNLCPEHA